MRGHSDYYQLTWQTETDRAICVRENEYGEDIWLPKTEVEYEDGVERGEEVEVEIPDWLAEEVGLL